MFFQYFHFKVDKCHTIKRHLNSFIEKSYAKTQITQKKTKNSRRRFLFVKSPLQLKKVKKGVEMVNLKSVVLSKILLILVM